MKIVFRTLTGEALSGADMYHTTFGNLLAEVGHEVQYIAVDADVPQCDLIIGVPFTVFNLRTVTPIICIVHNLRQEKASLAHTHIIYCANHIRERYDYSCLSSTVFHPINRLRPVDIPAFDKKYRVGMINCNQHKGGNFIEAIAMELPDYKFSCIEGWGPQIRCNLPNVEYLPQTEYIGGYYATLDCLLIPSQAEGYSTVALEAMSQGVHVIGSYIPGIFEVCNDYASYRHDVAGYVEAIQASDFNQRLRSRERYDAINPDYDKGRILKWVEAIYKHGNTNR